MLFGVIHTDLEIICRIIIIIRRRSIVTTNRIRISIISNDRSILNCCAIIPSIGLLYCFLLHFLSLVLINWRQTIYAIQHLQLACCHYLLFLVHLISLTHFVGIAYTCSALRRSFYQGLSSMLIL